MEQLTSTLENIRSWWSELHYTVLQRRALAIIAILVVTASGLLIFRTNSNQVIAQPPMQMEVAPTKITIDVAGGVTNPGVYQLESNARVIDAIAAAGGALTGADTSDTNLARLVKDGEQIYIYPPSKGGGQLIRSNQRKAKPAGPIMLNRATAKELESLDGIGPVLASRIIAYRKINGAFTNLDDLLKVSGIGAAKFAQFKAKIRI